MDLPSWTVPPPAPQPVAVAPSMRGPVPISINPSSTAPPPRAPTFVFPPALSTAAGAPLPLPTASMAITRPGFLSAPLPLPTNNPHVTFVTQPNLQAAVGAGQQQARREGVSAAATGGHATTLQPLHITPSPSGPPALPPPLQPGTAVPAPLPLQPRESDPQSGSVLDPLHRCLSEAESSGIPRAGRD